MKFTAIEKRKAPKIDFLTEGVRMNPSAYQKAIDSNKVTIGFELEFLVGKGYQNHLTEQIDAVMEQFEDSREDFTKAAFLKHQHLMVPGKVAHMLADYLRDRIDDRASEIGGSTNERFESFIYKMRDIHGNPLNTVDDVMRHISTSFEKFETNINLTYSRFAYNGEDPVGQFIDHLNEVIQGKTSGMSEEDLDKFLHVMYRCDLTAAFKEFNVNDLTDDEFEDVFQYRLNDDDDFERLFLNKSFLGQQTTIADFLSNQTGIKIKDVSNKYAGAARSFNSGSTGYYLEIDGDGPELISDPMPMDKAIADLQKILKCIQKFFKTDSTRGLHINVSLEGLQTYNIDLMKLMLFLGEDHLLKQFNRAANEYTQPQMKNFMRFFSRYSSDKENFEKVFMSGDAKQYQTLANAAVTDFLTNSGVNSSAKYHTFNPLKLFGERPYLEFRIMGNEGYESKWDEIKLQILRYVYAITLAMDENAERQVYAKKLYRLVKDHAASHVRPSDYDNFMKSTSPEKMGFTFEGHPDHVIQFTMFSNGFKPVKWDGPFFVALNKLKEYGVGGKGFNAEEDAVTIYSGLALIYLAQKRMFNIKQRNIWKNLTQEMKRHNIELNTGAILPTLRLELLQSPTLAALRKPDDKKVLLWAGERYEGIAVEKMFKLVADTAIALYEKG
jgi:hypothetical protein